MKSAGSVEAARESALDRLVRSRTALMLAFGWGLAEATFFFLVPDVLLSLLGCRALRPAIKATVAALAGALVGGAVMMLWGARAPEAAREFLDHVPAISQPIISSVQTQIAQHGLLAVLIGPVRGIPYKIYAVEWGAQSGGLISFLLISIPARYIRFLLSALVFRGAMKLLEKRTQRRADREALCWALFWVPFYSFYFARFGW